MKKVRFESSTQCYKLKMDDSECHSPRPFIEKQTAMRPELCFDYPRLLPYNPDPVQRYECSNSSPYPVVAKTSVNGTCNLDSRPSNDLELSMLDGSHYPRHPSLPKRQTFLSPPSHIHSELSDVCISSEKIPPNILSSIENTKLARPARPMKSVEENNFFIKRDNLCKIYPGNINSVQNQLHRLSLNVENDPLAKKAEFMHIAANDNGLSSQMKQKMSCEPIAQVYSVPDECQCHHCVKVIQNAKCSLLRDMTDNNPICRLIDSFPRAEPHCPCMHPKPKCPCSHIQPVKQSPNTSHKEVNNAQNFPKNTVDKKAWMMEKYDQNNEHDGMAVEKQNNCMKEKREPTVADLFKIIKLQNEQLQLLQEKVDKFISNTSRTANPIQNYMTEQVALKTLDSEQHKISIGVMTSFEMVRTSTSTIINKEIVTQTNENAQIQCNRSQISIKEVLSKTQPGTCNFLDGIMPADKAAAVYNDNERSSNICDMQTDNNIFDDKTLNELSLYNVQVDNATTPLISPEQSLYLDVRDYSDSDSGSDNQSNVGWTYYNKVMTHVNGMLQDSEMPSSASALFRNTKQQCLQMQIDKTNVSVTKRVKFGDDPLGFQQPHIYAAGTDTSMKMNQLAAKYLKGTSLSPTPPPPMPVTHKTSTVPIEMSFATRDYMERHRILQGNTPRSPPVGEIPRFLDITALKRQPKLL